MSEWAVVFVAVAVLGRALVQRRASSTVVTGPMVFVAFGLLVGSEGLELIELGKGSASPVIDTVLDGTLALLLYTDAAALHPCGPWNRGQPRANGDERSISAIRITRVITPIGISPR